MTPEKRHLVVGSEEAKNLGPGRRIETSLEMTDIFAEGTGKDGRLNVTIKNHLERSSVPSYIPPGVQITVLEED
ncbi:MAG: hypothetical protein P8Y17_01255 [Patescibacteria group bacterium]|jgi:hypothetical protein